MRTDHPASAATLAESGGRRGDEILARNTGRMTDDAGLDALAGQIVAGLLARSHLLEPGMIPEVITEAARPLGVQAARVYLSDLQQRSLRLLPGAEGTARDALAINTTVAGQAYRTIQIQQTQGTGPVSHLWIPLVDGTERLGVMELEVCDASPARLEWFKALASLAGLMVVSKASYSDTYAETRRTQEMALQAELVWAFLPPRTFATDRILVAATMEPAYAVAGDAFDYSMLGADDLYVAIFDAAGHDLSSGLMASVAIASCRSTRRAGGTLLFGGWSRSGRTPTHGLPVSVCTAVTCQTLGTMCLRGPS
jgi:hypothetical protein